MTDTSPIPVIWREGVFEPATQRQAMRCNQQFVEGRKYALAEHHDRSTGSHNHYFVSLQEAWLNLPEDIAHEFPSLEKFRATGLIATGFYNERQFLCGSEAEARRLATFLTTGMPLAVVSVAGAAVVERTAKSQSYRAMGKAEFNRSKQAVLAWASELVGIDLATLTANAGRAA